jgi:hypothetical protein
VRTSSSLVVASVVRMVTAGMRFHHGKVLLRWLIYCTKQGPGMIYPDALRTRPTCFR